MPQCSTGNAFSTIPLRHLLWLTATTVLLGCNIGADDDATKDAGGVASGGAGGATTRQGASGGSVGQGGQSSFGGSSSPSGGTPSAGGNDGAAGSRGGSAGGTTNQGGNTSGGATSAGGAAGSGGSNSAGGSAAGGAAGKGGSNAMGGMTSSTGGASASGGATSAGGATSSDTVFGQCRFHFGTIDTIAKNGGASLIGQLDYFTPGWMGTNGDTFDQGYVCDEGKQGGTLGNLVPVVVSYIAAGYVKRHHNLCDGNVSGCSGGDLGKNGAQYIAQDWSAILTEYKAFAAGYAGCWGTTRPIVVEMEPDWYQYTVSTQNAAWTAAQAGSKMTELVNAIKGSLPNARFSIDVSPWVGSNGSDNGKAWYSNFNMGLFTFVNTSGGGTNANTTKIRSSNNMTWSGLSSATGKPILADTGYGANGVSAGHDQNWDVVANINARIADGVTSIAQYNPNSSWGATISGIRSQLNKPKSCP